MEQTTAETLEKAFEHYDKGEISLAEQLFLSIADEDSTAMFCLGEIYWNNEISGDNNNKALFWYEKAAECGNGLAQLWLGNNYCIGIRSQPDPPKAFYWYQKAAEQNMTLAQYHLGICYSTGWGCEVDNSKALECMKDAARNNFFPAELYLLDNARRSGNKDYLLERNRFEEKYRSTLEGNEQSFWEYISYLIEDGFLADDGIRAFALLSQCKQYDEKKRLWFLACCYERGIGTSRNIGKAIYLLKQIAKDDKRARAKLLLLEAEND